MTVTRSVLVIDGSVETKTVLQAVLEPRGTHVRHTRGHRLLPEGQPPDVIVIDLDNSATAPSCPEWQHTPQVVIASERVEVDDSQVHFLEKPFHYPELIRLVEELLSQPAPPTARAA